MTNQRDIDAIVDTPEYLSLISCSGWPTTRMITTASKTELLQGLIFEVVHKREAQMRSFCTGLKALNFLTLIRAEPEKLRSVFVHTSSSITPETLQSLVVSLRPNDAIKGQVYDWFMSYLKQRHSDKGIIHFVCVCVTVLIISSHIYKRNVLASICMKGKLAYIYRLLTYI